MGRIVKPHGVRGAIVVFPLTEDEARFAEGTRVHLSPTPTGDREVRSTTIRSSRPHRGRRLLELEGLDDRIPAERLAGWYVVLPVEEAEAARGEGEFFRHGLVGREVRTVDGRRIGTVGDVIDTAASPLVEIETEGGRRRLLPFVRDFVRSIEEEVIVVEPPAGWEEL